MGYGCSCSDGESYCSPSLSRLSCDGLWRRVGFQNMDPYCYLKLSNVRFHEGIRKCRAGGGWPLQDESDSSRTNAAFFGLAKLKPENTWIAPLHINNLILRGVFEFEKHNDNINFIEFCPFLQLEQTTDRSFWPVSNKFEMCNKTKSMICMKYAFDSHVYTDTEICPRKWFYSPYFNECLTYFGKQKTYNLASKECKKLNAKIASYESQSHFETLRSTAILRTQKLSCTEDPIICDDKRSYKGIKCACNKSLSDEECQKFLFQGECRTKNCLSQWYRCSSDMCERPQICIDNPVGDFGSVTCINPVLKIRDEKVDQPCTGVSCLPDSLCLPLNEEDFRCFPKKKISENKLECLVCNSRIGLQDCLKKAVQVKGCVSNLRVSNNQ